MGLNYENHMNEMEAHLDEFFSRQDDSEMDLVLKALSLILYQTSPNNTDMLELYNTVPLEHFLRVVTLFENQTVKFPSKREIRDALLLAISYYYRDIKGYEWKDIQKIIPFDPSSISFGLRIKSLNRFIKTQLDEVLRDLDEVRAKREGTDNGK